MPFEVYPAFACLLVPGANRFLPLLFWTGSIYEVIRCNCMTIAAKHQTNAGGAVSVRDKKGHQEMETETGI